MTIYILSEDHSETARWLDDKSLERMINDVEQVLCNVHWYLTKDNPNDISEKAAPIDCPLYFKNWSDKWSKWARECNANYSWLFNLGLKLIEELQFRNSYFLYSKKFTKIGSAIFWVRDNFPNLAEVRSNLKIEHMNHTNANIPVVIPNKYKLSTLSKSNCFDQLTQIIDIVMSYRNYYQAKLKQKMISPEDWHDNAQDSKDTGCIHSIKWTNSQKPEWLNL